MWQVIDTTEYFTKVTTGSDFQVYVTDFSSIWYLHLLEEKFLDTLKDANPILEMADAKFLQKGKEMLSVPRDYHHLNISKLDTKLMLSAIKRIPFKLKLELELNKGSKEMFFQHVTQVLLQTVNDLKSSQLELRTLLNKKDKEIDEYKSKGVEISARHLKTNKFNESDHLSRHKTYEDNFGASSLPEFLLKKSVETKNEELAINKKTVSQPVQVKPERQSQTIEVKIEPQSQNTDVKTEPQSQSTDVKTEPQSQNEAIIETNSIKQEEIEINRLCSPKKKMKRLNL